jgi:hypothetical protein
MMIGRIVVRSDCVIISSYASANEGTISFGWATTRVTPTDGWNEE